MQDKPLVDSDYLLQLASGDSGAILEVLGLLEHDAQEVFSTLDKFNPHNDDEGGNIYAVLHKFKGSVRSLGFVSVGDFIENMENEAKASAGESIEVNRLRAMFSDSLLVARSVFEDDTL